MKTSQAVPLLAALAQETRLSIFRALVQAGPDGLSAGRIAEAVGAPASTLSFHLKELAAAGLVRPRQEGRFIFYSTDFAAMSVPTTPPAPDRLSTMSAWPHFSVSFCATMRPNWSVPPPGAMGMMKRTGLVGYGCWSAARATAAHSVHAATAMSNRCKMFLLSEGGL